VRLLIIEDDSRTARYLMRGLSESAHVVDHAADGETGLAMALGCWVQPCPAASALSAHCSSATAWLFSAPTCPSSRVRLSR